MIQPVDKTQRLVVLNTRTQQIQMNLLERHYEKLAKDRLHTNRNRENAWYPHRKPQFSASVRQMNSWPSNNCSSLNHQNCLEIRLKIHHMKRREATQEFALPRAKNTSLFELWFARGSRKSNKLGKVPISESIITTTVNAVKHYSCDCYRRRRICHLITRNSWICS